MEPRSLIYVRLSNAKALLEHRQNLPVLWRDLDSEGCLEYLT